MGLTNSKTILTTSPEEDHFFKMPNGNILGVDTRPDSCRPFISGQRVTMRCTCPKDCSPKNGTFLGKSKKRETEPHYAVIFDKEEKARMLAPEKINSKNMQVIADAPLEKIEWLDPSSSEVLEMLKAEPRLDHYLQNKHGAMKAFDVRPEICAPYVSGQLVLAKNPKSDEEVSCILLGKDYEDDLIAFDFVNQVFRWKDIKPAPGPIELRTPKWLTPDEVRIEQEREKKESEEEKKSDSDSESESESSESESEEEEAEEEEEKPAVKQMITTNKRITVTIDADENDDDFEVVIRRGQHK